MNNTYTLTALVNYSEVDAFGKMRFDAIASAFQMITGFHSKEMGVDGATTLQKSNAYWVLSRLKFKIFHHPSLYENLEIETFPTTFSAVKFARDYKIHTNGALAVAGVSEWCTLDVETKTIRRTNTICYPFDMEHRTDRSGAGDFLKIKEDISEEHFCYTAKSLFVDIDTNMHTNNVAYVRMALNCFSPREFNAQFSEFEIAYLGQTYLGDEIRLYKKKTDYGYFIEGKLNGKTVFNCVFKV